MITLAYIALIVVALGICLCTLGGIFWCISGGRGDAAYIGAMAGAVVWLLAILVLFIICLAHYDPMLLT